MDYVERAVYLIIIDLFGLEIKLLSTLSTQFSTFMFNNKNNTESIFLIKNLNSENKVTFLKQFVETVTTLILNIF